MDRRRSVSCLDSRGFQALRVSVGRDCGSPGLALGADPAESARAFLPVRYLGAGLLGLLVLFFYSYLSLSDLSLSYLGLPGLLYLHWLGLAAVRTQLNCILEPVRYLGKVSLVITCSVRRVHPSGNNYTEVVLQRALLKIARGQSTGRTPNSTMSSGKPWTGTKGDSDARG